MKRITTTWLGDKGHRMHLMALRSTVAFQSGFDVRKCMQKRAVHVCRFAV